MVSLFSFPFRTIFTRNYDFHHENIIVASGPKAMLAQKFLHKNSHYSSRFSAIQRLVSRSNLGNNAEKEEEEEREDGSVEDVRVPSHWLEPSKALEESEWLRVTLHKWLDDEYCPEATNIEISKVAARSYYNSLVEKQMDLGEILLRMARELETISYQESFHGAFSSANAAVSLIIHRIDQE